ncbi:MAG: hypothetical protein R3B54_18995 [Bdellovibrionota bacterium]
MRLQKFRDAADTDPTDTDEMDTMDFMLYIARLLLRVCHSSH